MNKLLIIFLIGLVSFTIYSGQQACGNACSNDNQCDPKGGNCTFCENGVCSQGKACGSSCNVDTDCGQGCGRCLNSLCTGSGACKGFCNSNSDCDGATCGTCTNNTCLGSCGDVCGSSGAPDCANENCPFCVNGNFNLFCKGNITCGATCFADSDCSVNATNVNCTKCVGGFCRAYGCGADCLVDSDCDGTDCVTCTNGACSPSPCGSFCNDNNGCDYNSGCSKCDGNTQTCVKGAACQESCQTNSDCDQTPDGCSSCVNGICTALTSCGSACTTDFECYGYNPSCGRCNTTSSTSGECVVGNCGDYCQAGNNNSCNINSGCSRCIQTTEFKTAHPDLAEQGLGICTAGIPCNGDCTVNSDCDQSTCPLCSSFGKCVA